MKKQKTIQVFLVLVLLFCILGAMSMGRYSISFDKLLRAIWNRISNNGAMENSVEYRVIFQLRLPRIIMAALCGLALSVSGAVLQGVFRNPLVGPSFIGVSSGAAFGAVSAILISLNAIAVMAFSFVGGVLSLLITLAIAGKVGSKNILSIILGGIVTGALFSALVSVVTYIADPRDSLPVIVYWLMGSFSGANSAKVWLLGAICLVCFVIIFRSRYVINILALGDEEAYALGVKVLWLRILFLALTTLLTSAAVSVSGTIGWVGLIVPHIARIMTGPDYRTLLVSSALIGAIYMIIADTIVRISAFGEVPIGILSALVGAPVLAYLLNTRKITG